MSSSTISYVSCSPLRTTCSAHLFTASSSTTSRDGATHFAVRSPSTPMFGIAYTSRILPTDDVTSLMNVIWTLSTVAADEGICALLAVYSTHSQSLKIRISRFTSRRKPEIRHSLKRINDSTFPNTIYLPFLTCAFCYLLPVFLRVDWPSRHSQHVQLI